MFRTIAVVGMLALGGCQTISPGGTSSITNIQNAVKAACAFVPTAQTVAALLGKHIPYVDIISEVCVAVGATGGPANARATFKVHGVAIHGRFVK